MHPCHIATALLRGKLTAGIAALASISGACIGTPPGSTTNVAIRVAPLTLPGVDEACYTVTVKNGQSPPATVWSADICSTQFGNGSGAIAYIGPCDAQHPSHTVELTLTSLSAGGSALVHPADFVNPTATSPIVLPATCVEDADTPVTFNVTILRSAVQGFFDIAVNFDDVFCSAKLDCAAGSLLHDPETGERIPTAVAGLACTGGPGADTHLYYSAFQLTCDGVPLAVSLARPPGNFYSLTDPAPGPFAQVASYQGAEQLTNPDGTPLAKIFFNVAFGLPVGATGDCSLSFSATVSDGALGGCATPAATVYPVLRFAAPSFVSDGAFACGDSALDAGDGVSTGYVGPAATERFAVQAHADGNELVVDSCGCDRLGAGTPFCCRTYPIPWARLDGMELCGTGTYGEPNVPYGFHWEDRGIGAVTSVDITIDPGLSCDPSGIRTTMLNGAATTPPTFEFPSGASCTCSPPQFGTLAFSGPTESYFVGGQNRFEIIDSITYEGFMTMPGTSNYATVAVCYDSPPPPPGRCDDIVCAPPGTCQLQGVCDPGSGVCDYAPAVGAVCYNGTGDPCFVDACDAAGACVDSRTPGVAAGTLCDNGSGDPCFADSCDAFGACLDSSTPSGYAQCDDGDSCTTQDQCDGAGHCVGASSGFDCAGVCCAFGELCVDGVCAAPPEAECLSYETTVRDGGECPVSGCPTRCLDILASDPSAESGIYLVDPSDSGVPFPVRCDMDYDGGGWTLVGYERAGEPNPPYAAGALQYLHADTVNDVAIANGTDDGIIGVRFPFGSHYDSARFNWCDPAATDNLFARFSTPENLFEDTRRDNLASGYPWGGLPTIVLSGFFTNDAFLNQLVPTTADARFCRAATLSPSYRPGDTSWALKDNNDANFRCGCNSGGWAGVGTYYGGEPDGSQSICIGWGGGWAGSKTYGQAKGGQNNHNLHVWIR